MKNKDIDELEEGVRPYLDPVVNFIYETHKNLPMKYLNIFLMLLVAKSVGVMCTFMGKKITREFVNNFIDGPGMCNTED